MKSSNSVSFREQVATVSSWFDLWNPCEQTVALYSLLKKLGPVQGRFLGLCLAQQGVQASKETRINEQNANDPMFVRQLEGATHLVQHLPLLRPGNEAAKRVYLEQIPHALSKAVDSSCEIEEARQLLSYALIHPALGNEERRALGLWLRHLEQCIASPQQMCPQTLMETTNNNLDPAMKDIMSWLKTLRLHKYSSLLMSMSYDQMMELTEDQLEAKGVTQGARNKLILNIKKLQQRQQRLQGLQKDLECGNVDLKGVMEEVRGMLVSPMKAFPPAPAVVEGDIPGEVTRLLGKLCSTLLVAPIFDSSLLPAYICLLDKCLAHESFGQLLKRRIYSWKQQMVKFGSRRRPYTLPWMASEQKGLSCGFNRTNTMPYPRATGAPMLDSLDYEDRLESLCLSMTEHAIGDTFRS